MRRLTGGEDTTLLVGLDRGVVDREVARRVNTIAQRNTQIGELEKTIQGHGDTIAQRDTRIGELERVRSRGLREAGVRQDLHRHHGREPLLPSRG